MNVHSKDDKCCCDWKQQIKQMWERLQTTIYGVKVNGTRVYPDGDGIVNIVIGESGIPIATEEAIGGVLSASADGKVSVDPLTGEMTANGLIDAIDDVEQLESEIIALQNEDINLGNRLTTAEADINEHDQDIVTIDGQIDAINTAVSGLQVSKQDKLTSGANIKTIDGETLLGAGNIATKQDSPYIIVKCNTDPLILTLTDTLTTSSAGTAVPSESVTVTPTLASTPVYGQNGLVISRSSATISYTAGESYAYNKATKPSGYIPEFDSTPEEIVTHIISNIDTLPDVDLSMEIRVIAYDPVKKCFIGFGSGWHSGGSITSTVTASIRNHVVTYATFGSSGSSGNVLVDENNVFIGIPIPMKISITQIVPSETYQVI